MAATQAFLVDFRATRFGMYSDVTEQLVGMTKPLNYVTKDKSPEPQRRIDRRKLPG
jgi:chlorite dismutase